MIVDENGKTSPLISVALCTYNGEKYLQQQLESILSQTYKNLEVIVVDDKSVDKTEDIIYQYMKTDKRIKFYSNAHNLGFNKNFEKAISLSTGDYIAISDQDDLWELNKIEDLYKNIKNNWLIFSNSALIDSRGEPLGEFLMKQVDLKQMDFRNFLFSNYTTGHTSMIHRDFLKFYLPIPNEGFYDWWMGFIAAYHKKIIFYNEVLTKHRVHNDSVIQAKILSNSDMKSRHNLVFNVVKQQLNNFKNYPYLQLKDKIFLEEFENAYTNGSKGFSFKLFWLYLKHFNQIHPDRKNKSFLSKVNYLRKISRAKNSFSS